MNNLLADNPASVIGTIDPPSPIQGLVNKGGSAGVSEVLTNIIVLIYQVAIILFLFMILFSALQWILSGGDKEKVAAARGRLTNAVIGIIILGLAGVIVTLVEHLTGIKSPLT